MNDQQTDSRSRNFTSLHNRLRLILIVSGLIYLFVFTLPFPLTRYYSTIPPVDYTKLTDGSQLGFLTYIISLAALFGLFIWAVRLAAVGAVELPRRSAIRLVWIGSILFAAILLLSYPLTAIDLFIYAIRSRGWALYGLPPLSTPPEALPASDPWLGLAGEWVDAASPYGPLWEGIALSTFYLSGGSFLAQLFLLKAVGLLAYLGCVGLIYRTLLLLQPGWAVAGTLAFAWNPLVLFESVQNGHNDILMIFFFLAAVRIVVVSGQQSAGSSQALALKGWWPRASRYFVFCVLAAASVLVKFVTVVAIPFFLIALAMRERRWSGRLLTFGLLTALLLILVIGPMALVWPGWQTWAVVQAGSGAGRSLLALLVLGLRPLLGINPAFDSARIAITLIFVLIYLHQLWRVLSPHLPISPSPLHLPLSAAFHTFFWYVLLAAPVFHAWYLLWFLPLASLLLPQQRALAASIVFSITALMVIPYFETVRVWYPFLLRNHFIGHLIGVPLLILPPLVTLLWPVGSTSHSEVSSDEKKVEMRR